MVSMTEANQNFSKVARLVDQHGSVVILKTVRLVISFLDFAQVDEMQVASDEEVWQHLKTNYGTKSYHI